MSTKLSMGLLRAVAVLEEFASSSELSFKDIVAATGLSRATAHRVLSALEQCGILCSPRRGYYSPAILLADIGGMVDQHAQIAAAAEPELELLAREFGETSFAMLRTDDYAEIVSFAYSYRSHRAGNPVGNRIPLYLTSHGRVLLAGMDDAEIHGYIARTQLRRATVRTIVSPESLWMDLEEVRAHRYSMSDQQAGIGVMTIAVPVVNTAGRTIIALAISAPTSRASHDYMRAMLPLLWERSAALTGRLYRNRPREVMQHPNLGLVADDLPHVAGRPEDAAIH